MKKGEKYYYLSASDLLFIYEILKEYEPKMILETTDRFHIWAIMIDIASKVF